MKQPVDRSPNFNRPNGPGLMHQNWGSLLFMHWPIPASELRPLIPPQLTIDEFDGTAWIAVVPFTMWGIRPIGMPPIPGLSAFHELNVRTYVQYRGVPGVWFFSLDANSRLAVWGARLFYSLPYRFAEMTLSQSGETINYSSTRLETEFGSADFNASWTIGTDLSTSAPGSLTHFLTERYCLYAIRNQRVCRCRIFHNPWPLKTARVHSYSSTMLETLGLASPTSEPILHHAEKLHVNIWPLRIA